jgi:hypothetical protein
MELALVVVPAWILDGAGDPPLRHPNVASGAADERQRSLALLRRLVVGKREGRRCRHGRRWRGLTERKGVCFGAVVGGGEAVQTRAGSS